MHDGPLVDGNDGFRGRRPVAQCTARSFGVVVFSPALNDDLGFSERILTTNCKLRKTLAYLDSQSAACLVFRFQHAISNYKLLLRYGLSLSVDLNGSPQKVSGEIGRRRSGQSYPT